MSDVSPQRRTLFYVALQLIMGMIKYYLRGLWANISQVRNSEVLSDGNVSQLHHSERSEVLTTVTQTGVEPRNVNFQVKAKRVTWKLTSERPNSLLLAHDSRYLSISTK